MTAPGSPDFEVRTADWLEAAEAQRRILDACPAAEAERIPLSEALGRALAEDLHADALLPPWDNAAMDGYAVRGEDMAGASPAHPVVLRVRGLVRAGGAPAPPLEPGEAIRIMTGAPVPEGADSVVRVEDTDAEGEAGRVRILRDRDVGGNVRPGGQDLRPGDLVFRRGDPIHPGAVGVLAALGRSHVFVGRRPLVAILTTGDELRSPDRYEEVRAGAGIPESNGPMLAAAVAAAGGIPRLGPIVPDDPDALVAAIRQAGDADLLVTVGGASMGEADLVKRALDRLGFRLDFWRVRMRPGSPFSFGWLPVGQGEQPVFGLPGNPASAFVTFEVLVRPFLLKRAGHTRIHRPVVTCQAAEELRGTRRALFSRVRIEPGEPLPRIHLSGPQGSGLVRGLASAEGLAMIPSGATLAAGDPVRVMLLDPGPAASTVSPLEG